MFKVLQVRTDLFMLVCPAVSLTLFGSLVLYLIFGAALVLDKYWWQFFR